MTERVYCGEIDRSLVDQQIIVKGWVHRRRDLGGMVFVDLRDRSGLLQIVFSDKRRNSIGTSLLRLASPKNG